MKVFNKNFAEELAVIRPATPRRRPNAVTMKPETVPQIAIEEATPAAKEPPPSIPPINIEPAPTPIPASVQHPGSMSRSSSLSLHPYDEDSSRTSIDTGDSDATGTVKSQDRRSLTSRITGTSFRSVRKTLSFRGRRSSEIA